MELKETIQPLYTIVPNLVNKQAFGHRNRNKLWEYGYNAQYDIVIISKDGTLGEVYCINGVNIGLPKKPTHIPKKNDKWEVEEYPKELSKISQMSDWNKKDKEFKIKWIDYIEKEFVRREEGYWFINKGEPTYITGSHYMYLQWSKIDIGLPEFREANRILYIFWEACKADPRCFGMCYLKIRRSGFSFMASEECCNIGTQIREGHIGIMSKTAKDASDLFTKKVVNMYWNYPFFFKPIQSGMDKPKTELEFSLPASKITRKNMDNRHLEDKDSLNTSISWRSTGDNSYDSQKLQLLIEDEAGKVIEGNILSAWRVRKTCLRLGSKIIGKCMMGSTSNKLSQGGENYKKMFHDSNPMERSNNGQTKSGLYALYIPTEWNLEGFIDEYGWPIVDASPKNPVMGIDGVKVTMGVIEWWQNEVNALKKDADALNEFYRQFSRTISHAFRDESQSSLFNLEKIYSQIDYNEGHEELGYLVRGHFAWYNGVRFGKVIWIPNRKGRFLVSWIPPLELQNQVMERNGLRYPLQEHIGAFGCDPYDIKGVVGGGGSKGSLHGKTGFHMLPNAPLNDFFLEYVARPETPEIFFEDVLMALHFYGMPALIENNKPRLLYYLKNNGYRPFAMNRPDKHKSQLSSTEIEIGGIPNNSEDIKQAHAGAIQTYIEKFVGYDSEGHYRPPDTIGTMPFNETLKDWAAFDIDKRTKHDASISSGLACMATQKNSYLPQVVKKSVNISWATYDNRGFQSEIIL